MIYLLIFNIFSLVTVKEEQGCPANCLECTAELCTSCNTGYGLIIENEENTGECHKCPEYCSSCSQENYKICNEWSENTGPILDENGEETGEHAICPGECDCSENASQCKCRRYYGKVLDKNGNSTGQCAECPNNCLTCSEDSGFCDECDSSYGQILNKNGEKTGKCSKCLGSCYSCKDDYTFCTSCSYDSGMILDEKDEPTGKCSPCLIAYCENCKENYKICESCISGFALINGKCVSCPEGCDECTNLSYCISCQLSFGPVYDDKGEKTGKCAPCPEFCDECEDGPDSCTRCEEQYGLILDENGDSTGKCERCRDANCYYCYDDSNKRCDYYSRNIDNHNTVNETKEEIVLSAKKHNKENLIKSTIEHCIDSSYDPNICSVCDEGYGFEVNEKGERTGGCKKCGQNCLFCRTNADSCTLCENGYGFVLDDKGKPTAECKPCQDNCLICTSDYKTCKQCSDGFGLELDEKGVPTGECKRCTVENCLYCPYDNTVCALCIPNFGRDKNDPTKCKRCLSNYCDDCDDDYTFCSKCHNSDGITYIADSNGHYTGQCTTCPSNCDECYLSEICDDCDDYFGFEKNANGMRTGKCGRCPDHCEDCYYDSSKCTICTEGYGKDKEGKCQPCPANCLICEHNLDKCMKCSAGYFLQKEDDETLGNCVKCVDHCIDCTSTTECKSCDDGYKLSDGKCIACPPHCESCGDSKCYYCDDYYTLDDDGNCIACPVECGECNADKECLNCNYGYGPAITNGIINESICLKCPTNCGNCDYGADYCFRCEVGFDFNSNHECVSSGDTVACSVEGCMICISGTSDRCQYCSQGYNLDKITEKCVKEYESVETPSKEQHYIYNAQNYGTLKNDKRTIDIGSSFEYDDNVQLYLKFDNVDFSSIDITNADGKDIAFEFPSDLHEMTFGFKSNNFDIQLPSNNDITIKLGSETTASIINGAGSVTLDKVDDDQNKVNINKLHIKSDEFNLNPNVNVDINEVDLNGKKTFIVELKENSKVDIKTLKVQQNSEAKIKNVELTGNVILGLGSSLTINNNVKLEQSTLDFPFDSAQLSSAKAPLNGDIAGKPSKILISSRTDKEYLDAEKILLVQSSKDFNCKEWGDIESKISGKNFEKDCFSENNDFRLYAIEKSSDGQNDDDKLSPGIIAAIVIAVVVVVGVVVFLLVFFLVIKKRRNNSSNKEGSEKEDNANEV